MNFRFVFFILIFFCSLGFVRACSCVSLSEYSLDREVNDSDMIFLGKVNSFNLEENYKSAFFQIESVWKGERSPSAIIIFTAKDSAGCGYEFEVGKEYIVFAYKIDDKFYVNSCGRTGPSKDSKQLIDELNRIFNKNSSSCRNYFWFDENSAGCGYKQFCGMYMYQGLQTFNSKESCENAFSSRQYSGGPECVRDADCKLIYNSCSCAAVPKSDSRNSLDPTDRYCERNDCTAQNVKAVCQNNKCVKSTDAYSSRRNCEKDSDCSCGSLASGSECACIVNNCVVVSSISNNSKESVKISVEQALTKGTEILGAEELEVELRQKRRADGDSIIVYYNIFGEKNVRLFGFINTRAKVEAEVDAHTGELISVKKPWWAFLASGI